LPWLWFDRIENQINRTDTKAQLVLAVDALLLGWFSTQHPIAVQTPSGEHEFTAAPMAASLRAITHNCTFAYTLGWCVPIYRALVLCNRKRCPKS
jgi:hypothetical protein